MVFGGLHQDKDHSYHYHLMISANRAGETGRLRLSKAQFREVQVQLERHVLREFPELEQKVAIEKRAELKRSRSETELERRTGKVPKKDQVRARVQEALEGVRDRDSLMAALGRSDLELYVRGKTLGVIDHETGKRHRLKTLDLELADRVEGVMMEMSPEPDQEPDIEEEREARRADAREAAGDFAGEKEKEGGEREDDRTARDQGDGHSKDRAASEGHEKSSDREAGAERDDGWEPYEGDRTDSQYDRADDNQAQGDARPEEDVDPREEDDERFQGRDRGAPEQARWREEMERHRSEQRDRERDRARSRDGPDLSR